MALDPITAGIEFTSKIVDRIFPDKAARDEAKLRLFELQQSGEIAVLTASTDLAKAQLEVNRQEAASNSLWVAGWRPFVGWTCGAGFAYAYIIQPFLIFVCTLAGQGEALAALPRMDLAAMLPVLMGMLGLAGLRTREKEKGTEGDGR